MWEEVGKWTLDLNFEEAKRRLVERLHDFSEVIRWEEKFKDAPGTCCYEMGSDETGKGQIRLVKRKGGTVEVTINKPSWPTSYLIEPIGTDAERQWQIMSLREFIKGWITWLHDEGVFSNLTPQSGDRTDAVSGMVREWKTQANQVLNEVLNQNELDTGDNP